MLYLFKLSERSDVPSIQLTENRRKRICWVPDGAWLWPNCLSCFAILDTRCTC